MLNFYKLIEILVSLLSLVITTMLPVYIPLQFINKSINSPIIMYKENALKTTFLWKISVNKIIVGICHVIGNSKLLLDL